jgi:hypothetical protein
MATIPPTNNTYNVLTSYTGPDAPRVTQTWLLPPAYTYNAATPAQALNLPSLWTGKGDPNQIAYANDDYVLKAKVIGSGQQAMVIVTLQLTGKNAWNTGAAWRTALRANFVDIVQAVESQFELSSTPMLVAGSTALIASALAQFTPMPMSEVLLYGYGLQTGIATGAQASVDLTPGMRLRSEPSVRQYLAPPNQSLSAYVATGELSWTVASNVSTGTRVSAFDAFLGTIAAAQVTPPPSAPVGIYSLIDLEQTGGAYRYYRLTYPQNVPQGTAPGAVGTSLNIRLTGANTVKDLNTAPPYTAWFFGRDVVIPEIAVAVQIGNNGSPRAEWVPVGTTLVNLLERYTRWLPLSINQGVLTLKRLAISPNQGTTGAQNYFTVNFQQPGALVNDLSAFPLPLLAGDQITLVLGVA